MSQYQYMIWQKNYKAFKKMLKLKKSLTAKVIVVKIEKSLKEFRI